MSLEKPPLPPPGSAPARRPTPPFVRSARGRALPLALMLLGLMLVAVAVLPSDPIVAAFSFTLGFVVVTAAGILALTARVRRSGRPSTTWPSSRPGVIAAGLLVLGWVMAIVPELPWLADARYVGAPGYAVLNVMLVAGLALLVLAGLLAAGAAWWGTERSRVLVALAVLHVVWVSYFVMGVLPGIMGWRFSFP